MLDYERERCEGATRRSGHQSRRARGRVIDSWIQLAAYTRLAESLQQRTGIRRRRLPRSRPVASQLASLDNQLAIATTHIEAFIAGCQRPTPDRLQAVLSALTTFNTELSGFESATSLSPAITTLRPVKICELVLSETVAIEAIANAAAVTLEVDLCTRKHVERSRFLCDPVQVSQVIQNVLLNAIKYAGRGGHVRLATNRKRGGFEITISDNGPGVALEERLTIFDRGVRGSAAGCAAGSGLGLAVVRSIVAAHGGSIRIVDRTGGGACFVIRFPGETAPRDACDLHRFATNAAYAPPCLRECDESGLALCS